jgi:hypothetical protein
MNEQNSKSVTRRTVLLAAAGAAPLLALGATGARAALPPTAVSYQDSPKDGKQCDGCKFFIAPNSCKTVSGNISPQGWCKLWAKKS